MKTRRVWMSAVLTLVTGIALLALPALGSTVALREGGGTSGGITFVDTPIDAVSVAGKDDPSNNNLLTGSCGKLSNYESENGVNYRSVGLVAVGNLFSLLPATRDGMTLQINSATLVLYPEGWDAGTIGIYRVTTHWLYGAAGTNDAVVTGLHPDGAGGTATWAAGSNGFSVGDYDLTHGVVGAWPAAQVATSFAVTDIVKDMYSLGYNDGFVMRKEGGTLGGSSMGYMRSYDGLATRPQLIIDYSYVPEPATMGLLVLGGVGALRRRRK